MHYIEDDFNLNEASVKPVRNNKNKKKQTSKMFVVLYIIFFICLSYLVILLIGKHKEANSVEQINEAAREIIMIEPVPFIAEPVEPVEPAENASDMADDKSELAMVTPVPDEPKVLLEKIIALRELLGNDDIVGWLTIEGTAVDNVVVQASDNEYYLRRDINGEHSTAGTFFMDYENNTYDLDRNTVIYGHNMRNGSMFHDLRYYTDRAYYDEHRYILLMTPYEETIWEVFAFYETSTDFYYIQVIFPDDDAFMTLLSGIKEKSLYDTGVDVTTDDSILSLSTCADSSRDTRYALHAKRVRSYDSTDTSQYPTLP